MVARPSESEQKIRLLTRMNRGRRSTPTYLAALTQAVGEIVPQDALVPLAETDRILESFRHGYRTAVSPGAVAYRRFFAAGQEERVFRVAQRLGDLLSDETAYFMTKASEDCGAIRFRLRAVLRHATAMIRLDGDSLSALSLDHAEGLLIDHTPDDEDQTYEITVWGDRWPITALSCSTA